MAMKQREAVFQATTSTLAAHGIEFSAGTNIREVMTAEIRSEIADRVTALFQEGQVELKSTESNQSKLQDVAKLRNYVTGLITNWFNKDPNLNGGVKHQVKNPGSRQSDTQLKEMRLLRKQLALKGDDVAIARVDAAIAERINELGAAKAKPESIDADNLPEFLRDLAV